MDALRTTNRSLTFVVLAIGLLAAGCRSENEPRSEAPSRPSPAKRARLDALGYVSTNDVREDDLQKRGVVRHDPARVQPGVNLWNSLAKTSAVLMDAEGRTVHEWSLESAEGEWGHLELLPDGDLLVFHQDPDELIRLDWNSEVRWRRPMLAHHDGDVDANGHLWVLDVRRSLIHVGSEWMSLAKDWIVELDADGEIVREIPLTDLLSDRFDLEELAGRVEDRDPRDENVKFLDPTHANTLALVPAGNPGPFGAGRILFAARNLDLVAVLDPESETIEWTFGPGELDWPHQPALTSRGTVLVFDNGAHRGWSRIVEVDPGARDISWEYRGDSPDDFFSRTMGSVQPLPNGNVFVSESERGRAFEITRSGDIVWEFFNPELDETARTRGTFYRMKRVTEGDLPEGCWHDLDLAAPQS
ncbi:MAG: aryl-sulfate sulfotransferase [Gemmatimonadetes bacterium]|nr:aryl-sulfate sulfotransferase [Gemmatimonadota bacterium]